MIFPNQEPNPRPNKKYQILNKHLVKKKLCDYALRINQLEENKTSVQKDI